jgi:alkylhydroperoxidase family enzyme
MTTYPIHTVESAPEAARPSLRGLEQAFGLVPNVAATMANCPPLLNTFVAGFGQFAGAGFTGAERQVLLLSNAVANRSPWAVAFHSTLALKEGVTADDVAAVRDGGLPADPRLAALSATTRALIEGRGRIAGDDTRGLDPDVVLAVVTGIALSAMANYTGNLARTPVEAPFQAQAWSSGY